jgi:hypothetical protein
MFSATFHHRFDSFSMNIPLPGASHASPVIAA